MVTNKQYSSFGQSYIHHNCKEIRSKTPCQQYTKSAPGLWSNTMFRISELRRATWPIIWYQNDFLVTFQCSWYTFKTFLYFKTAIENQCTGLRNLKERVKGRFILSRVNIDRPIKNSLFNYETIKILTCNFVKTYYFLWDIFCIKTRSEFLHNESILKRHAHVWRRVIYFICL